MIYDVSLKLRAKRPFQGWIGYCQAVPINIARMYGLNYNYEC